MEKIYLSKAFFHPVVITQYRLQTKEQLQLEFPEVNYIAAFVTLKRNMLTISSLNAPTQGLFGMKLEAAGWASTRCMTTLLSTIKWIKKELILKKP